MGQLITLDRGASIFDSTAAFAMIRGGHVDITVMGGLQVSERGDLANWSVPRAGPDRCRWRHGPGRRALPGDHRDEPRGQAGTPKLVRDCTLPLTGQQTVDCVITELAVFDFIDGVLTLRELQPGVTLDEVREKTEATLPGPPVTRRASELEK